MKRLIQGFTLIEIFVVIAIIAVLAAIIFPVLARAKWTAKQSVEISNLRQCYLAASIYASDNGGWDMLPVDANSANVFRDAPTCSLLDNWRKNCSENWGAPMVGSYGYGGYTASFELISGPMPEGINPTWQMELQDGRCAILIDAFVNPVLIPPFHGESTARDPLIEMPTSVLDLLQDGSVHTLHIWSPPPGRQIGFSWPDLFLYSKHGGIATK